MTDTDRIETVAQALYDSWSVDRQPFAQVMAREAAHCDATVAVAALDAYDREHADMCRHESMHGDNTDPRAVQTWTCDSCGHWVYCQPDRSLAAEVERLRAVVASLDEAHAAAAARLVREAAEVTR